MARTLMSEVLVKIESNLEGASGALVTEARRVQKLNKDLAELRGHTDESIGTVRDTTITGLFFGGFLAKSFRTLSEVSGVVSALISVLGGLAGTALDVIMLALVELGGKLADAIRDAAKFMETDEVVITPFGPLPDVTNSPSPDTVHTITPAKGITEAISKMATTDLDDWTGYISQLSITAAGVKRMRSWLSGNKELDRMGGKFKEIKDMEALLVADPTKTLADFWVNAITRTEGWKKLIGGTSNG